MRDELHAEDLAGLDAHLIDGARDLDAAALAPAAGVDLRLDHPHAAAERRSRGLRLVDRECRNAARRRHAVPPKDFLALIFVDFHAGSCVDCGDSETSARSSGRPVAAARETWLQYGNRILRPRRRQPQPKTARGTYRTQVS